MRLKIKKFGHFLDQKHWEEFGFFWGPSSVNSIFLKNKKYNNIKLKKNNK
jgi:hypothetical protein